MAIQHPSTMQPMSLTAQSIFDDYLPQILKAVGQKIDAVMAFNIAGVEGGAWTVDLSAGSVERGMTKKADFYLGMSAADFADMLKGKFNANQAVSRVEARGRMELLATFGSLL